MDIKARIQQLMGERGWTIYRLAKEANVPWTTLRNMFVRNTDPSISTLEAICKGMGISLPQFFDVENNLGLSEEQNKLLQNWSRLNDKDRHLISELLVSLNTKS